MTCITVSSTQPSALYELAEGVVTEAGEMIALNAEGKAVKASDSAGIRVIGYSVGERSGSVMIGCALIVMANDSTTANAIIRSDRGAVAYVKDSLTVSRHKGTNGVIAGVIVDVDDEGVTVDMTPAALAAASALHLAVKI